MSPPRIRVALKYCGSCNPHLNLVKIAAHLTETFKRENLELVPFSGEGVDAVVILCGCPRACANRDDIRAGAKQSLLLAGEFLQGKLVREESLFSALDSELINMVKALKKGKGSGKRG